MTKNTKIEWADHTFNPWIGCTKVSPACDHCYAENMMDTRLKVVKCGAGQERKRTSESNWQQPLKWNSEAERLGVRYRVFCSSLADVFDNAVPAEWRYDLFNLIISTQHLDWLLLTKRIGNAAKMIEDTLPEKIKSLPPDHPLAWPWPNVWIGEGVTINSTLLKRKLINGRNLIQVTQSGGVTLNDVKRLTHIYKREEAQRERLKARFANRAATPATADFDLPMASIDDYL